MPSAPILLPFSAVFEPSNRDLGDWGNLGQMTSGQRIAFLASTPEPLQVTAVERCCQHPTGFRYFGYRCSNPKRLRLGNGSSVDSSFSEGSEHVAKMPVGPIGIGLVRD